MNLCGQFFRNHHLPNNFAYLFCLFGGHELRPYGWLRAIFYRGSVVEFSRDQLRVLWRLACELFFSLRYGSTVQLCAV